MARGSTGRNGFLPRTYQFRRRRPSRARPLLLLAAGCVALAVLAGAVFGAPRSLARFLPAAARPALPELSNAGRYSEVLSRSADLLAQRPLDAEALLFRGIAHFYLALAEAGRSDPAARLEQAVIALRRARLSGGLRYRREAAYLLGKAYYHRGRHYYDLTVRYLTEALEQGYAAADVHEYLGMALVRAGAPERGIEHLRAALQQRPSALLYLSLGQLQERLGQREEAQRQFREAAAAAAEAGDRELEIRARFMLGALLLQWARYADAGEQYRRLLDLVPDSADAHLFLGDAYAGQGDGAGARAEWRRARGIDQQHHGANLRLRG